MAFTTSAPSEMSDNSGNSPPSKSFTIAIVGGGLAGLTLAIGLLNQGVPIHIYESAPAFAEIGAGVRCNPNAVKVLELIDPRIWDGYRKCATFNSSKVGGAGIRYRWGQDCRNNGEGKKAGDLIWQVNDGAGISAFHRAKFLDEMVKILPGGVASFGKRLTDVVELDHAVKLTFADGTTAEHSAVVGCDGIKSRLREIMYPEIVPQFTGDYCYRGLIPMELANEVLGEEIAGNGHLFCGYGGYIVTYPVDQGRLMNMVAVKRTDRKEWGHEPWVVPASNEDIQRDFKGWEPKLVDVISRLENERWALFDVPLTDSYAKGRMCIVGDAAHASTPHLGAGAGMAFEDAYIMSNILGAFDDEKEIPAAFQAFDATRRARTSRLVFDSRDAGLANELSKEGVADDLLELQKDIDLRYEWIWNVDLDIMRRETMKVMNEFVQSKMPIPA